jgi:integrase
MANAFKRDFLLLTILTGLRKAASCAIKRVDFDEMAGTLRIPRPKGGRARAFVIPLSDAAMVIVRRRYASTMGGWLFPSERSASGHIKDLRPYSSREGFSVAFTIHGLRATYIGAAHAAGVTDRHAQLLANHAVHGSDVHGGYILHDPEALRPSQQRVTDFLRKYGLHV